MVIMLWNTLPDQQPTAGAHSDIKSTIKGYFGFSELTLQAREHNDAFYQSFFCSVVDPAIASTENDKDLLCFHSVLM